MKNLDLSKFYVNDVVCWKSVFANKSWNTVYDVIPKTLDLLWDLDVTALVHCYQLWGLVMSMLFNCHI